MARFDEADGCTPWVDVDIVGDDDYSSEDFFGSDTPAAQLEPVVGTHVLSLSDADIGLRFLA